MTKEEKSEYNRQYKANNLEYIRKAKRDWKLKARYGITRADYDRMVETQGGLCKLCGRKPKRALNTDHDHTTGRVRGLLCWPCNWNMRYWEGKPDVLLRLVEYLKGGILNP